jgi:hypothetical protein
MLVAMAAVPLLFRPSEIRACECSLEPTVVVRWPQDGATGVAIDSPIVVWAYQLSLQSDAVRLVGADGERVPLNEVLRLPPAWSGCGKGEQIFLRPAHNLQEGATFMVSFTAPETSNEAVASFTVGDQTLASESAVNAEVNYLSVYKDTSCIGAHCSDAADLSVDVGRAPQRPLWLVVESSAAENGKNDWVFWPDGWFDSSIADPESRRVVQLGVALAPDDDCVNVRIYGIEGRALLDERHCEPDRCAVYSGSTPVSACGGPAPSGVDITRVPAGSCEHPIVLGDAGAMITHPTADAGMATADAAKAADTGTNRSNSSDATRVAGGGCSVVLSATTTTNPMSKGALILLVCLMFRRSRVHPTSRR